MKNNDDTFISFKIGILHELIQKSSSLEEKIYQIYGYYRLGDYQKARVKLQKIASVDTNDAFIDGLRQLLNSAILEENQEFDQYQCTHDTLKPMMDEFLVIELTINTDVEQLTKIYENIMNTESFDNNHLYIYKLIAISRAFIRFRDVEKTKQIIKKGTNYVNQLNNEYLYVDLSIQRSEILRIEGKFQEATKLLTKTKEKAREISYFRGVHVSEQIIGINHFRKGEYELAKKSLMSSLDLRQNRSRANLVAHTAMLLGMCYLNTSEFSKAEKYLRQAKSIHMQSDNIDGIMAINGLIADIYEQKGRLKEAEKLLKEILIFWKTKDKAINISETLLFLSSIKQKQGNYSDAIKYLRRSQKISEIGGPQLKGRIHTSLGDIHRIRGEFENALEAYFQGRNFFEQIDNSHEVAMLLKKMGLLYYEMNEPTKMEKFLDKSLILMEEIQDDVSYAELLFWKIKLIKADYNSEISQQLFESLEKIYLRSENIFVQLYYHMAQVYLNLKSQDLLELAEAKKIVLKLLEMNIPHKELTLNVNLWYLEILLFEFDKLGKNQLYDDIQLISTNLIEFVEKEQLVSYYAKLSLIQSRLYMLNNELELAEEILRTSLELVMDKSVFMVAIPVARALDELVNTIYQTHKIQESLSKGENKQIKPIHSKFLTILDPSWEILFTTDFEKTSIVSEEMETLIKIIKERHTRSNQTSELYYYNLNQYRIALIDAEFVIIYIYNQSSYIVGEKLKLLISRLRTSNAISSLLENDNVSSHTYLLHEFEKVIEDIFPKRDPEKKDQDELIIPEYEEIRDLKQYKEFLHPIRLSILLILERNYQLPRFIIQELIEVNPGTLKNHLDRLLKKKIIGKSLQFIDEKPRDVYYMEPNGESEFKEFQNLFQSI